MLPSLLPLNLDHIQFNNLPHAGELLGISTNRAVLTSQMNRQMLAESVYSLSSLILCIQPYTMD